MAITLDLFSRRVVGWSLDSTMEDHHSDRGSQNAVNEFRKLLAAKQLRQSMSRKGNCWDNAPTESFFHTLKTEHIYFESVAKKEEARESIFEYIEVFYNRERLHSTLGYKSPVDFEKEFAKCA